MNVWNESIWVVYIFASPRPSIFHKAKQAFFIHMIFTTNYSLLIGQYQQAMFSDPPQKLSAVCPRLNRFPLRSHASFSVTFLSVILHIASVSQLLRLQYWNQFLCSMSAALIMIVTSSFIFFNSFVSHCRSALIISIKTVNNWCWLDLDLKVHSLRRFALAVKWASGVNF